MAAKKIYLDQNIYGAMLDGASDWRASAFGKVLVDAQTHGIGEVWLSPTHVLELMQASDVGRMQALAQMMLELSAYHRMLWSYEYEVVACLLAAIEEVAPGTVDGGPDFQFHADHVRQAFLGALAMMGHGVRPPSNIVEDVLLTKLTNRLICARGAADLDQWLKALRDAVDGRPQQLLGLASVDGTDRDAIERELQALEPQVQQLRPTVRGRLQKQRNDFVRAYTAWSVAECAVSVFQPPLRVALVLDLNALVAAWSTVFTAFGSRPVPSKQTDEETRGWVLREVIKGVGAKGLPPARIAAEVYFNDWERSATDGDLPTDGLTFDMDHAAIALYDRDVFVTLDTKLRAIAQKLSAEAARANGNASVIVGNPTELAAALAE